MANTQSTLLTEIVDDHIFVLTLNSPSNRNSLQAPGLRDSLIQALDQLDSDPNLRVAIITGTGSSFCSGGDLNQLVNNDQTQTRLSMQANAWLYRRIALSDKLIIAGVNGHAYGAGLGLALLCDWVACSPTATFCSAFTRVGAMPDAGLFWSLPQRIGVPQARRLMLTGEAIDAHEAIRIGLADECLESTNTLAETLTIAKRFAHGPTRAYSRIKAGLRQVPMSLEQALAFQLDNAPALFRSNDFLEGAQAFFDKRQPNFTGT